MTPLFGNDSAPDEAKAPRLEEQTVHVGAVERDNGVKTATYGSIRSALYDLSDRNSQTHTVRLPHGTVVKLISGMRSSLSSFNPSFEIVNASSPPKTAIGVTQAADLAKEIDVLAMPGKDKTTLQKMSEEEAPLQESAVKVSGYVTRDGKHVGAYSQIRDIVKKLEHGQAAHFPEGVSVRRYSGGYDITGGSFSGERQPLKGGVTARTPDAAATFAATRSAASNHPKSLGGTKRHEATSASEVDAIPAENPKLPGAPHPDAVARKAAAARKAAKLPSRKERADNEERAKEKALSSQLARMNTGQEKTLPNGVVVKRESTETHGLRVTDPEGRGPKKLLDAGDAAIWAVALQKESRESKRQKRRARDESPMPGVIRRPSESDAIRAGEGQKKQEGAAANIDKLKRKVRALSDADLQARIDKLPSKSTPETRVVAREWRRRKTAKAERRGFIGG